MLKGAVKNPRSGQSIMELLPAMMMFFIVLFTCLAYFRVMRTAVMREEAVRNVAFAKINNSGTLTTPGNHMNGRAGCTLTNGFLCLGGEVVDGSNKYYQVVKDHQFVSSGNSCFSVNLSGGINELPVTPLGFTGDGEARASPPIQITTYAVVYRRPGSGCSAH